ncbi:glutamate ABC transporter substrate-binding protein [Allokutzneria sp. A3M-2-11 16]|uniref:glutamate ABC transporter substrate-binding protein n=1 Tax=Allokutzneria sp. A3M-2-11 16 TaxID=2962043 RepID=UPI0020B87861|nr:glutamate ABC transporter substrate-binding protein [Allokutzneria sp. A3M-2-11 16]MCP3802119.1 glutamate ABC transporter substrate-binding protein [Allokutzneria sp. A3M-2-11 16]
MRFRFGAVLLAVALLGAGCAGGGDKNSVAARAASADKLTIGIRFDQPGIGRKITDSWFEGFDVDVATYVAAELGVAKENIVWKEARTPDREAMIQDGRVDLVVASYSITDARKQRVGFAGPYFVAGQGLLVSQSTTNITGPESLNGKKLCSVKDSTSAQKVKERYAQGAQLVEYFRYSECVNALLVRNVDAVTTDDVILAGYATQHPELLKLVGKPFSEERYGIGLRREDADGKAKVNAAIEKMISSGEWRRSIEKHLGPSGYPIPNAPAVTEK